VKKTMRKNEMKKKTNVKTMSRKVGTVYALLTVIPLLVCGYIVYKYIRSCGVTPLENLFLSFVLVFILSFLGAWILGKIGRNIETISVHAGKLAQGEKVGYVPFFL